jgi:hypothetical protein
VSKEEASDLARRSSNMLRDGSGFPSIWSGLIKSHLLVVGSPTQSFDNKRGLLEIRLITGQRLVVEFGCHGVPLAISVGWDRRTAE